jgi:hypothetical protein
VILHPIGDEQTAIPRLIVKRAIGAVATVSVMSAESHPAARRA